MILLSCFNLQGLSLLDLATARPAAGGIATDLQALLQFKAKITGDPHKIVESWNNSIPFCQWRGVTCCRKHRRVTKLDLKIPQEIGLLRRLEILDLTNNSISSEIPSNLSACTKLTVVDMTGNHLTGEIPTWLDLLSNLRVLGFYYNSLRGSIPPSLGNLSSLEKLGLSFNALSGIIPEALGQLTNLSFFSAQENAISGVVPTTMFNLSKIRLFDIGGNKIQGTLHSNLVISMPNVEFFSIESNQISGQIPISVSNFSNISVLQFHNNSFSGNVPSLEKLDKLFNLELGINHLGDGREGDLNFLCTLLNKTKLTFLHVGNNNFGGELPECISNFSSTLVGLVMSTNKIWGRIPNGIGNLINLEVLGVYQNQLSGPIPFEIGSLQKLTIFYAYGNFLSETIPHSIGNLTELTELSLDYNNLQGNIPSSLGNCQNLLLMSLSHNNLSGSIPSQVLGLSSMSILLDLSSNDLAGELPVTVGYMKNLGEFHVSQNRLSGLIPNNLGSCVSLEKLFLNDNLFEGPLPSSLSSLKGLEALDVSDNNLSGAIPDFLVSFSALKYLNLSFNDFEGVIPSEGVFKNASATFVEGNSKLCGGIPELHLSRCNTKTSSNTSHKLKIVIIVVTLGVALVFTCLLILWFTKKKERKLTTASVENSILRLSYQSIQRATDGFAMENLVGTGCFGSVYKRILEENGTVIAVKVLNLLNRGASRSFLTECEALKNIRHRNLVKILTAISSVDYKGNDFKALVYEFMENGSLDDWLHPSVNTNEQEMMRNLSFFQRVDVAVDVAHALEYLHHHCETSIIHCDLKPSNILLDNEMIGHIGDFGLAKILFADRLDHYANQSSSLGLRGTIGYAPPGKYMHFSSNFIIILYLLLCI
ncbi:hypothetical protein GQ457_14G023740 [Hibiscus cannabinus]